MADLDKVKRALEHAMRVTVGEDVRNEIEQAIAELEPARRRLSRPVQSGAPSARAMRRITGRV